MNGFAIQLNFIYYGNEALAFKDFSGQSISGAVIRVTFTVVGHGLNDLMKREMPLLAMY